MKWLSDVKARRDAVLLVLILVLALATHVAWFSNWQPITAYDLGFHHREDLLDHWFSLSHAWTADNGGNNNAAHLPFLAYKLSFGAFARLGVEHPISERLLLLWPIAILPIVTMRYLLSKLFDRRTALWELGVLLYGFNTYYFAIQFAGHVFVCLGYALIPLALACFVDALRQPSIKKGVISGLSSSLVFWIEPRMGYIAMWLLGFYLLYHLAVETHPNSERWKLLGASGISFLITGLTQSYWVLLMLTSFSSSLGGILPSQPWLSFMNILHAFALYHPSWTGGEFVLFEVYPVPFFAFVLPLLATLPLLFKDRPKVLFYFFFIGLLGVFLVKQSGPPLETAYAWLFDNLPGFNLFREASKFYLLISLSYSVLLSYALRRVHASLEPRKMGIWLSYVVRTVCLLLILYFAWPSISGELGGNLDATALPQEYVALKDLILSQPEDSFRTLWIPHLQRFGFYSESYPALSMYVRVPGGPLGRLGFWPPQSTSFIEGPLFRPLLDLLSVRYVILPSDTEDEIYTRWEIDQDDLVASLRALPWLRELNVADGLVIFETDSYTPHICAAPTSILVDSDADDLLAVLDHTSYLRDTLCPALVSVQDVEEATRISTLVNEVVVGPSPELGVDAWQAIASAGPTPPVSYLVTDRQGEFSASQSGHYQVSVHIAPRAAWPPSETALSEIEVSVMRAESQELNRITFEVPRIPIESGAWLTAQEVYLTEGEYSLEVSQDSEVIDLIEIASQSNQTVHRVPQVTFRKISSTRYEVAVTAQGPFWLVFSESFHPGWQAYVLERSEGGEIQLGQDTASRPWYEQSALLAGLIGPDRQVELNNHVMVNTYANAWYVPQSGAFTISLEYAPQQVFEIGLVISVLTLIICGGFLLWGWARRRRGRRHV